MNERLSDERLARLIAASQAEADPAVWARVRARARSDEARRGSRGERWLEWLSRPAAVAAAAATLVVVVGAGALVSRGAGTGDAIGTVEITSLGDWLLAEREGEALELPEALEADGNGVARDSGGAS
jgi:anti-sigma-K factor RskA